MMAANKRAGAYARVSTNQQECENQLAPLRAFAAARGWQVTEFADRESGAKGSRPELDVMLAAARRRRLDVILCTKLDRLGRSLRHLVNVVAELESIGVDLVVLDQQLDTTTASGRLLFHVLASVAEFERSLIVDRIHAGIARAKAQGRVFGRPRLHHVDPERARALLVQGLSLRAVARTLGTHATTVRRALAAA